MSQRHLPDTTCVLLYMHSIQVNFFLILDETMSEVKTLSRFVLIAWHFSRRGDQCDGTIADHLDFVRSQEIGVRFLSEYDFFRPNGV
jgi:hypothetical protein